MKQKIELYREVLELEPGSRVFFPLAKLLAQDARPKEGIEVLYKGLSHRPDHVEARLLLVELLSSLGDDNGLDQEMARLEQMLSAYPAFWKAWSGRLSRRPDMQDAALAGRFLTLTLQGKPLSWSEVIEEGLRTLAGDGAGVGHHVAGLSAEPLLQQPADAGDGGSDLGQDGVVVEDVGAVPPRHDEGVALLPGRDVEERVGDVVLVDLLRRDVTRDDRAEQAVHGDLSGDALTGRPPIQRTS